MYRYFCIFSDQKFVLESVIDNYPNIIDFILDKVPIIVKCERLHRLVVI